MSPVNPHPGSFEDMFLQLTLAKSGKVEGESETDDHKGEIAIVGWNWGMQAKSALSGAGPASKATVKELQIRKQFDRSSTVFMQALRANDAVKKAVISVRKAGGEQSDYLTITIENGRLTDYAVNTEGPRPLEEIHFSFKKIAVEYHQQRADGLAGGGMQYVDEFA